MRRIEVLEGPHTHERFKHGPVVVVKDLTDPQGPVEKTMYCDRFYKCTIKRQSVLKDREYDTRA